MRSIFFRGPRRNGNWELENRRPIATFDDAVQTGNAGLDGFSTLSRADPNRQGDPPAVSGTVGPVHQGPDTSFEQ